MGKLCDILFLLWPISEIFFSDAKMFTKLINLAAYLSVCIFFILSPNLTVFLILTSIMLAIEYFVLHSTYHALLFIGFLCMDAYMSYQVEKEERNNYRHQKESVWNVMCLTYKQARESFIKTVL